MKRRLFGRDAIAVLCVVVVVLVMLLLMLYVLLSPALFAAREKAREAACRSNLHEIGIAIESFRQDHDGAYMRAGDDVEHPDAGFTVGTATGVFDSSLTLALLHERYIEYGDYLQCPSAEHTFEFTRDRSTGGIGNIDADGDGDHDDFRFDPAVSADCDPDYLSDPRIPKNSASMRAVVADGPDLQHERFWRQPWADDPSQFNARKVSNHPNRVMVLRVDGGVGADKIDPHTGKAYQPVEQLLAAANGLFDYALRCHILTYLPDMSSILRLERNRKSSFSLHD